MVTGKGDVVGMRVVLKSLNWNWDCNTYVRKDKNI